MPDKPLPMDLLRQWAPEFASHQIDEKNLLFEHESYQLIPARYKILAGIAVAAALGSDMCTRMWTQMATAKGIDGKEIVEAMMVARYMKQATVNDTISRSLKLLLMKDGE